MKNQNKIIQDILLEEDEVSKKYDEIKERYREKISDLVSRKEEFFDWLKNVGEETTKEISDQKLEELQHKKGRFIALYNKKMKQLMKNQEKEVQDLYKKSKIAGKTAVFILSTTAILGSAIRANQLLNQKAKMDCKRVQDLKKRELCIKKWRINCLKRKTLLLKRALTRCKHTRNQLECKKRINDEIFKINQSIKEKTTEFTKNIIGVDV